MKIKLAVSQERYEEIKKMLDQRGIEIDENSDLVLSESNYGYMEVCIKYREIKRMCFSKRKRKGNQSL